MFIIIRQYSSLHSIGTSQAHFSPITSSCQAVSLARMDREDPSEDDPSPINTLNGEELRSPNSTADTESLPDSHPTPIAENGLGSPNSRADTESLPSISTPAIPRSPILRR